MMASSSIRHAALGTGVALALTLGVSRTARAQVAGADSALSDAASGASAHPASRTAYVALLGAGMLTGAAGGQILGSPKRWPRTWNGYSKRVGDQLGFTAVELGVQSIVGHQLPWRDDVSPCGVRIGVRRALSCGITRTFTLRTDDRALRPNVPLAAGVLAGTSASLIWRPEGDDAAKARAFFLTRVGIVMGSAIAKRSFAEWRASR